MKILVTGTRNGVSPQIIKRAFDLLWEARRGELDLNPWIVIHGGHWGVDTQTGKIAKDRGWWVWPCPASWDKHGFSGGPLRNGHMLTQSAPDIVLAFPGPRSRGIWDMVGRARSAGVEVRICTQEEDPCWVK